MERMEKDWGAVREVMNSRLLDADRIAIVIMPKPSPLDPTRTFNLKSIIRDTVVAALRETDGNKHEAAKLLGMSRATLYRVLSRYGLSLDRIEANQ